MSSEQPVVETAPAAQVDITQQATTPTPTTRPKNPKRVAAGKRVAERTRIAREQQKKAAAEASVIIANNNAKSSPPPEPKEEKNVLSGGLSLNQWIGLGGLVVSAAGLFLKREEIVAAVKKNLPSTPSPPEPTPAPPVEPVPKRKVLTKVA